MGQPILDAIMGRGMNLPRPGYMPPGEMPFNPMGAVNANQQLLPQAVHDSSIYGPPPQLDSPSYARRPPAIIQEGYDIGTLPQQPFQFPPGHNFAPPSLRPSPPAQSNPLLRILGF